MSQPKPPEHWFDDVMQTMLEERLDLLRACAVYGIPMTAEEGAALMRRKCWRESWEQKSRDYFASKAAPASLTKEILVGKMLANVEALEQAGKPKDANDSLLNIAKVQGLVGPESTTNIFQDLSGADFTRLRDAISTKKSESKPN